MIDLVPIGNLYFILVLIGVATLIITAVFVVIRRLKQHGFYRLSRRVGVLISRLLLRLGMLMHKHYRLVLLLYVLIFITLIIPLSSLQWIPRVAKPIIYSFYGLLIFNLVVLFFVHHLLDPVPTDATLDAPSALDPTKIKLIRPDCTVRFDQLIKLGDEAFAAWGGSTDDRCVVYRKFFEGNADSFKLVMEINKEEPIGFSCVLPLRESAFRQFRLGILDSWDFSWDDILPTSKYLCLNAIYIRPESHLEKLRAVSVLCSHIAIFVRLNNSALPVLVADGLTYKGRRFLKRCGFESYYQTKDQTPIYELDLSKPGTLNDRARFFSLCLQKALDYEITRPQSQS